MVAEKKVSASWLKEGDIVLAPADTQTLMASFDRIDRVGIVYTLCSVRGMGFSKGRWCVSTEARVQAMCCSAGPSCRSLRLMPSLFLQHGDAQQPGRGGADQDADGHRGRAPRGPCAALATARARRLRPKVDWRATAAPASDETWMI